MTKLVNKSKEQAQEFSMQKYCYPRRGEILKITDNNKAKKWNVYITIP
jgi:hypothetical protein